MEINNQHLQQGYFEPNYLNDHVVNDSPYVALYRAVIMQQILDYMNTAKSSVDRAWRESAECWLYGNSEGFFEVCHFAGWSANEVRELVDLAKKDRKLFINLSSKIRRKRSEQKQKFKE